MSTRRARTQLAILAAVALIGGCSGGAKHPPEPTNKRPTNSGTPTTESTAELKRGYEPSLTPSNCADPTTVTVNIGCFTLTLPEDRAKPTGRQVELPVIRVRSASSDLDPSTGLRGSTAPIVYLHGGPGAGAVDGWLAWQQLMDGIPGEFIAFDQRGGGHANPRLDCPERTDALSAVFSAHPSWIRARNSIGSAIRNCNQRLRAAGVDLSQYNVESLVADLEDLRSALGAPKLSLLATSYGTRLALTYQQLYPQRVASLALSGVVTPDSGGPDKERKMLEPALSRLVDACSKDQSCNSRYPELNGDLTSAGRTLDSNPITLDAGTRLKVTGDELYAGVFAALYDSSTIPLLPMAIHRIARGDKQIWSTIGSQISPGLAGDSAFGAQISISCSDLAETDDRVARSDPGRSRDVVLTGTDSFCEFWDLEPIDGRHHRTTGRPKTSDPVGKNGPPTIVIAGALDPITPAKDSRRIAHDLGAQFVQVPLAGHDAVFATPCARNALREFLAAQASLETGSQSAVSNVRGCTPKDTLPFS